MNTNIFIPEKINVGYQERNGTYNGKLAYVIYFDNKGILRKEKSWQNWRDKKIENNIFNNVPTEGFVINKKVGGYGYYNPRATYVRVYDPRGFEFEITIPNLIWILENCNCIKGKGLEGNFVYGWNGTELLLVPADSVEYKEIKRKNSIIYNNSFIKAKDLIVGATYTNLKDEKFVYAGRFDVYSTMYNYLNNGKWYYELDEPDDSWQDDCTAILNNYYSDKTEDAKVKNINKGKHYWFIKRGNGSSYGYDSKDHIEVFSSINKKFSEIVYESTPDFAELFCNMIKKSSWFSPIDFSKNKIVTVDKNKFTEVMTNFINENSKSKTYHASIEVFYMIGKFLRKINIHLKNTDENGLTLYYELEKKSFTSWSGYSIDKIITNIDDIYNKFTPVYVEKYLKNGELLNRSGFYYE